jgi:LytS/YehU family sensor histidine kinase
VDERIDAGYIEIPPLLIQPYVENAIWHGLMHKKEGGLIKIDVGMANEHLLHVEISDDGIGREKAMEYKSKSVTRQKSFGLKMTSERMGIINELYQTKTFIKIIDEKDAINNSCGTKVIIEIPV